MGMALSSIAVGVTASVTALVPVTALSVISLRYTLVSLSVRLRMVSWISTVMVASSGTFVAVAFAFAVCDPA